MTRADVAAVLDHLGTAEATAIELAAAATVLRGLAGVLVTEGDWLAAAELLDDMAAAAVEPAPTPAPVPPISKGADPWLDVELTVH